MSELSVAASRRWEDFLDGSAFSLYQNALNHEYVITLIESVAQTGSCVLEVGFGSGYTSVLLADMGYRVASVDLSTELVVRLARFRSVYPKLFPQSADMFRLPYASDSFEVVFSCGVLEHFPDDKIVAGLREQSRVAKYVLVDVPNSRCKTRPFGDERCLPVRHWKALIREAGLTIIAERGRDIRWWKKSLPGWFFHRKLGLITRYLGNTSIFLCTKI